MRRVSFAAIFAMAYLACLAAAQSSAYYGSEPVGAASTRRTNLFRSSFRSNFRRQAPEGNPTDDGAAAPLTQEQEPIQQATYGNGYANGGSNGGASADQVDAAADAAADADAALDDAAAADEAAANGDEAPADDVSADVPTDPDAPIDEPLADLAGGTNEEGNGGNGAEEGNGEPGADIDGLRRNIRGEPDVDYPILAEVPQTAFKCSDRERPGYYGDAEARCQVFHICQADDRMDSFLCPNGTIFSQKNFVCVWWWQYDCAQTEKDWALNENLFLDGGSPQDGGALGGTEGDGVTDDNSGALVDQTTDEEAPAVDDVIAEDPAADPAPAAVIEDDAQTTEGDAPAEDLPAADALVDTPADDAASADLAAGAYKNGYAANGYSRNGNGASSAAKAAGRFSSLRFGVRGSRSRSSLRRNRSRSRSSLRTRSRSSLRSRSRSSSRSALRRGRRLRSRSSSRRSRSRSVSRRRTTRRSSRRRSTSRRSSRRSSGRRSSASRRRRFSRQRFASRRSRRARN